MSNLRSFIINRIGWDLYLKPFMYKKLPSGLGWPATMGSLCALLFILQALTGMFLAMYYVPSPDLAYESINYIMNEVSMGRILRGIHHWGGGAMVVLVFIHMMHGFFAGTFKAPRELTWVAGVVLFLLTLGMGFTGYLLPWDQKAYWATVVSANIPKDIPVIGDFTTRLMLGGDRVSGLTLTRFFSMHMLLLPGLMLGFIGFHIYLVRIHGVADPLASDAVGKKHVKPFSQHIYRFYPEHLFKSTMASVIVLGVIFLLAIYGQIPFEGKAGTLDPDYLPRPEWYYMWLFQILTFFPGSAEVIGSLVIPIGGVAILFGMPWLSQSKWRGVADRPIATAMGALCLIGIIYLTLMGFGGARSYGRIIPVPDRSLNASELKGLQLFVELDCAYCHNINGRGGRIIGPDLANVVVRDRSQAWLIKFIKDPQAESRWTTMPKYNLDEESLKALADFVLALDFKEHRMKIISRTDVKAGNTK